MNTYSFVIPTYQSKKLIRNTLQALNYLQLNEHISYEVIVVDDGSTDGTFEYIKDVNKSYKLDYIYLPRCKNSSRSRARNHGIRKALGNIVVFIDGDILVKPNYLIQLDEYFKHSEDIAVAGTRLLLNEPIDEDIVENKRIFDNEILQLLDIGIDFRHKIFSDLSYNAGSMKTPFLFALTCNLAVPKKWIELVNGFDEDLKKWGVEDIEFVYRLYLKGLKIVLNNRNEVIHQFHGIKEADVVNENQIHEVDYNTSVFIKKHPNFMGLSEEEIYALFRSIATHYKKLEEEDISVYIAIEFNNINKINVLKEEINKLIHFEKTKVVIYDYVGSFELDIWLQLQTKTKAKLCYYPCFKTIYNKHTVENIDQCVYKLKI